MTLRRLLQIWEITCSSATLARYLEQNGWQCQVIARKEFDKHNCASRFSNYISVPGRARMFYWEVAKAVIRFNPSVILVRQNYEILPLCKLLAPRTPIIMQFHGAEVRHRKKLPWQARLATTRLVSTRDIAEWGEYYGTPIDPMFQPASRGVRRPGTALFIRIDAGAKDCLMDAKRFASENGLDLTIIDRITDDNIPHTEMPVLLQKFDWYLDLKGLTSKDVLSKTALEFLRTTSPESPGKVLTDTGDVVTQFAATTLEEYLDLVESLV